MNSDILSFLNQIDILLFNWFKFNSEVTHDRSLPDDFHTVGDGFSSVVNVLQEAISKQQLQEILDNVDGTMANVNAITRKADRMMDRQLPQLIDTIQLAMNEIHRIADNLAEADLKATVGRVDSAVDEVQKLIAAANSQDGTVGKLLNDKSLYDDINHTVNSADSLLIDLKANPKRYVHFSLWGNNDKEKQNKK